MLNHVTFCSLFSLEDVVASVSFISGQESLSIFHTLRVAQQSGFLQFSPHHRISLGFYNASGHLIGQGIWYSDAFVLSFQGK